jgi:crotonobetainyl-CoA:carnitine CoA-transferase CaiB-like acyl-CoA transferase
MIDVRVRNLLKEVGLEPSSGVEATIVGGDPVDACRFPVGEAAAVALAACGVAVSSLWELRGGRPQRARVEVRRAAASLHSRDFLRLDGGPGPVGPATGNPLVDFYRCRDGRWIHLHGALPNLAYGTMKVLGCERDRDSVAAAVGRWDGEALEDALADARMCGALVRTVAEWAGHPQGRAVADWPRVSIAKIGDSEPEPLPTGSRPLSGLRVLDLTRILAGPSHARTLAEHGADVLYIASPWLPNPDAFVMDTNHGKLSAFLDLDDHEDAARLRKLVSEGDVFSQSYRAGALVGRGFGPAELAELRPGLIYVSISCYGHAGPWEARPGWEQLAQTVTGIAAAQGTPDQPARMPVAACDFTTGYLAALGTMVALGRRAREGGSYHVRASLCQSGMWFTRLGATCDPAQASGAGDPADLCVETETPFGRLRHLKPALELSETPPYWARPTVPLGSHQPVWPNGG